MARMRMLKPEFFKSETLRKVDKLSRLAFAGLWTYVDDNGVGIDNEKLITAELWALEDDFNEELEGVRSDMIDLARVGLIQRYSIDGRRYFFVTNWDEHQKISHPAKPRYFRPTAGRGNPPGTHPTVVMLSPEGFLPPSGNSPETLRKTSEASPETPPGPENEATSDARLMHGGHSGHAHHGSAESAGHDRLRKDSGESPEGLRSKQGNRETGKQGNTPSPTADAVGGVEAPKPKPRNRNAKPKDHPRFAEFWDAYSHKVERLAAVKAFNQALEDGADPNELIAAAGRYARRCKRLGLDRHKIKHASGWLNGERWTDELDDDTTPTAAGHNLPPHCGQCDPVDRTLLTLDSALEPCPNCHPDRVGAHR